MRLRNIPGAREEMFVNPYVIQKPEQWKGNFHALFRDENTTAAQKLYLEIGMGKGKFITEIASLFPQIHFIGIEKYSSVLIQALKKQEKDRQDNLLFLRMDARMLEDVFAEGEVDRIYLNFSDPWPKERHAGRRLTSSEFLTRYSHILKPGGTIEFKTDNRSLYDFSLEQAHGSGWKLLSRTTDLHADPVLSAGNIMTEYEERFTALGNPICKMVIERP